MQLSLSNVRRISLTAAAIVLSAVTAVAAESPSITSVLFDKAHLTGIEAGTKLTYNFIRKASEPKLIGPNIDSVIELTIDKVNDNATSDVTVQIFRGELERDPRKIEGMTGNPVLVFFLDRAVSGFSLLAGGNGAYHKNRFRVAMRTEGGLAAVKFDYKGSEVDGYRLSIRPFTGDRMNIEKMKGYENAQFDFLMSEAVPGYFAAFKSHYNSPKPGSPALDESIVLEGVNAPEIAPQMAAQPSGEVK